MLQDQATQQVLAELREQHEKTLEAESQQAIRQIISEESEKRKLLEEIEKEVRPGFIKIELSHPQNIYLSQPQAKIFLASDEIITLERVPLYKRVLSVGEKVIISIENVKFEKYKEPFYFETQHLAEVLSITPSVVKRPNNMNQSDLILKKLPLI